MTGISRNLRLLDVHYDIDEGIVVVIVNDGYAAVLTDTWTGFSMYMTCK